MRLDQAFHELRDGYVCNCCSNVFNDWRVRIMRIDGECVCDFYQLKGRGNFLHVPKTCISEKLYRRMLRSDDWNAGEPIQLGGGK